MTRPVDDRAARFEAFFDQQWAGVVAYARRRTAGHDDAHDVAAETFATAWRRFDDIPPDRPEAWLYRTARLTLANRRRSNRRFDDLQTRLAHQPTPTTSPGADRAVIDAEANAEVLAALATLTEDQQELLRLVAWEQLDHPTIAAIFSISPNAVASRLKRARHALGDALATSNPSTGHIPGDATADRTTP